MEIHPGATLGRRLFIDDGVVGDVPADATVAGTPRRVNGESGVDAVGTEVPDCSFNVLAVAPIGASCS